MNPAGYLNMCSQRAAKKKSRGQPEVGADGALFRAPETRYENCMCTVLAFHKHPRPVALLAYRGAGELHHFVDITCNTLHNLARKFRSYYLAHSPSVCFSCTHYGNRLVGFSRDRLVGLSKDNVGGS
jgi:hypothetical protein